MNTCYHCGDDCVKEIIHQKKSFCCHGCKTVFDILNDHDLSYYYNLETTPGSTPQKIDGKYDFLENEEIVNQLLSFSEGNKQVVSFLIPSIHCSSCIWVLENLNKLHGGVLRSQVNFPEKTVQITFVSKELNLKSLAVLLAKIGYEPYISLEDTVPKNRKHNKKLIYQLGVAGFAFGNVMFLSFPEYFEETEFWLERFKHLFRWLMFAFSIPAVFYAGRDYFISAIKGLRSRMLTIDVPIAIGIMVLFVRSTIDITFDIGSGFFDSLTGLIFFLLVGKFFQQKTYAYLSFERDYKSYFPIAVTRIIKDSNDKTIEIPTEIQKIKKGDLLHIRNAEIIPVDGILRKGSALIDYSFVTGEAEPVMKSRGDTLFAGGRQQGASIEIEVTKSMSQSYLTQLWSNDIFSKNKKSVFQSLTDSISKRFTIAIVTIAFISMLFWLIYDPSKAFNVFTAVLIVACPCAIALASPFTLGNLLRLLGAHKLYLKESGVIEQMAKVDTLVFDKTGTLTSHHESTIRYEGIGLSDKEEELISSSLRASNHPLSRSIYEILEANDIKTLDTYHEEVGQGISARLAEDSVKIGSYEFASNRTSALNVRQADLNKTKVHISTNNCYKGCYVFHNRYREGLESIMYKLAKHYNLIVLSGDNEGERTYLEELLPKGTALYFNKKPQEKLDFIKALQEEGKSVLMLGDGLNDAGALKQSNVGIVISENTNVFTPACDGILDARKFKLIPHFLTASKQSIQIIKWSFMLSLFYNLIGLSFAIAGLLEPVIAAILMPLSSISVVVFTTLMVSGYIGTSFKKFN